MVLECNSQIQNFLCEYLKDYLLFSFLSKYLILNKECTFGVMRVLDKRFGRWIGAFISTKKVGIDSFQPYKLKQFFFKKKSAIKKVIERNR